MSRPGTLVVEVRGIRPAEIERAGALTVAAYRAVDGVDVGEYHATLFDVADRAREAVVLVAVDGDDVLLGTVTYVRDADNQYAEFNDADGSGMRMLAVDPAAQGRGVGTALVQACLDRAVADGRARMVLHTMEELATARRMYERFGFTRAPRRDWRPRDGILLLGYERPL